MFALTCTVIEKPSAELWDLVSGILYQFHTEGIEEEEVIAPDDERSLVAANEFELAIEPGILEPPKKFIAYFKEKRDAENAQRALQPKLNHLTPAFNISAIQTIDYTAILKQNFHAQTIEPCWYVRASWHTPLVTSNQNEISQEIIIDPGMAFGTGTHETTQMCLSLIAKVAKKHPISQATVLDFGCGSGILAIALKKLATKNVIAVDIDPLALESSTTNAQINQVSIDVRPSYQPLNAPKLDGIVANILKNTLLDFAPQFAAWLKPQGFLILSGLLVEQADLIINHYSKLNFSLVEKISANNWVSLYLSYNPNHI